MKTLEEYKYWLTHLHRSTVNGGAPHKPILILAILQLVSEGEIFSNQIQITPSLVARFKELWRKLVNTDHKENFSLPFFHMRKEPFWTLRSLPGKEFELTSSRSIKSFSSLRSTLLHAELDMGLFGAMASPQSNSELTRVLLEKYFGISEIAFTDFNEASLEEEIDRYVLGVGEFSPKYGLKNSIRTDKDAQEEWVFIRGGRFKKIVPELYNYTCAISGMKIISSTKEQMVDACHIKPFSAFGDDRVTNGVCFSPNLHRAFDRGLISIDNDYQVLVSTSFSESDSAFAIRQFEGKRLELPANRNYWPAIENLEWHRASFGF